MFEFHKNVQRPVLISGPCSAETEEQVLETAKRLKNTGKIHIFRSGIWKPRTRPGSFEGVGEKGLPWLVKVKQQCQLPVAVEVANADHVELCLKYGIDMVWIGARTTVNPFAVQEIADACAGTGLPVMLKNPVNPDLSLWLGGMERLLKAGITQVAAIHRGFSFAGEKIYRNRPQWQIAIDFKTAMPDVVMVNDPSHICGRRDILYKVAQKAMDLDFDGLMIESHVTPDEAWSDATQQITPEVYAELINHLIIRDTKPALDQRDELYRMRKEIDMLDDELMQILAARMEIARKIGLYKKKNNLTILQTSRWIEVLEKFKNRAADAKLSEEFISRIIKSIHDESIETQENVMNDDVI